MRLLYWDDMRRGAGYSSISENDPYRDGVPYSGCCVVLSAQECDWGRGGCQRVLHSKGVSTSVEYAENHCIRRVSPS